MICIVAGSLLSQFIEPVYLTSIILGSLYHGNHLSRALYGRLGEDPDLPEPYQLNRPLLSGISNPESRQPGKAPNFSCNWLLGDPAMEAIQTTTGKRDDGMPSRLCKYQMFIRYLEVLNKLPEVPLLQQVPEEYHEAKMASTGYQVAKEAVTKAFEKVGLGAWVKKPMEQDIFYRMPEDDK